MQNWQAEIDGTAKEFFADLVSLRRHLHKHPELSGAETATASYLFDWLKQRGVTGRMVAQGRGILVDIDPSGGSKREPSPRLGLRADMDALQIQDAKDVSYRSSVQDVMHACGHDVHSTILAGSLVVLRSLLNSGAISDVAVRGIFQPAEEICVGATEMIAERALDEVDNVFAFHVDPFRDIGTVGFREGVMSASCDELVVTITGKGGHAARPHHTRDPITAVAQFLNAVHVQVPRGTDSLDTVVVGFGLIKGGEQCNVIPDVVTLRGTLRTLTPETRAETLARLHEIARGIGDASRTTIDLQIGASAPAVVNDANMTAIVEQQIVEVLGETGCDYMHQPSMGGEDFAYYLEHVRGALVRLGTRVPGEEPTGLHTPNFDVDERVIEIGVRIMARTAIACCRQGRD